MKQPAISVLVIDDELAIRRLLQTSLEARGYRVHTVATGEDGVVAVADRHPDIIILDLGLPKMDGLTVIEQLREWTQTPIVILSARDEEVQKIAALDLGADDYLTKPFGTGELLARIRVALRHAAHNTATETVIRAGELVIDLTTRQVMREGQSVHLTPTEYNLLRLLATNLGRVLTHGTILREIWGPGYQNDTQLLRGFIAQLRQKIEPVPSHPRYVITEPGVGYRMVDPPAQSQTGSS